MRSEILFQLEDYIWLVVVSVLSIRDLDYSNSRLGLTTRLVFLVLFRQWVASSSSPDITTASTLYRPALILESRVP